MRNCAKQGLMHEVFHRQTMNISPKQKNQNTCVRWARAWISFVLLLDFFVPCLNPIFSGFIHQLQVILINYFNHVSRTHIFTAEFLFLRPRHKQKVLKQTNIRFVNPESTRIKHAREGTAHAIQAAWRLPSLLSVNYTWEISLRAREIRRTTTILRAVLPPKIALLRRFFNAENVRRNSSLSICFWALFLRRPCQELCSFRELQKNSSLATPKNPER